MIPKKIHTTQDKIAKRRADIPVRYRGIYGKAMNGHSRAMGIKAFCLECMGWSYKDSADCNTVGCPLHPYNPYIFRQDPEKEGLAERQSTNGLPLVLDSQIAAESLESPVTGLYRKENGFSAPEGQCNEDAA